MTFQFDKLTIKAQEAVAKAQSLAAEHGNPEIDTIHLLATLCEETDGIVWPLLDRIGVQSGQLSNMIHSELDKLPKMSGGSTPPASKELAAVFNGAASQASEMKDDFVSTEHLLLALAETPSTAQRILEMNGVDKQDIFTALQSIRGSARVTSQSPESQFQALEK